MKVEDQKSFIRNTGLGNFRLVLIHAIQISRFRIMTFILGMFLPGLAKMLNFRYLKSFESNIFGRSLINELIILQLIAISWNKTFMRNDLFLNFVSILLILTTKILLCLTNYLTAAILRMSVRALINLGARW